jgi:hypothetical protein
LPRTISGERIDDSINFGSHENPKIKDQFQKLAMRRDSFYHSTQGIGTKPREPEDDMQVLISCQHGAP